MGSFPETSGEAPLSRAALVFVAAVPIATASLIGLIMTGSAKLRGEATGRSSLEGGARATSEAIASQFKIRFQDRGWIS
jgi:hypothetical protein